MAIAGEKRHIHEEVVGNQADEEGRDAGGAVDWSKSVGSNSIR